MAVLFMEGWDQYADIADIRRNENLIVANTTWSFPATGRNSQCLRSTSTSSDWYVTGDFGTFIVVGVAWKYTTDGSGDVLRFLTSNSGEQIVVRHVAGGELAIDRGSTQLEVTSGLGLVVDVFYYLEVKITIHPSAGTYDVYIDEVEAMADTGVNTEASAGLDIKQIEFSGNTTMDPFWDDIYVLDGSGLENTDFLGDVRIDTLTPDGDGNRNDFTAVGEANNWEAVDDGNTPDDDSTYNHSTVVDEDELYTFTDLVATPDTIFAIQVTNHYRSDDAGARQVRALVRSNTTEAESAAQGVSGGALFRYANAVFETNPDGGAAWDEAAVNAVEAGITIES